MRCLILCCAGLLLLMGVSPGGAAATSGYEASRENPGNGKTLVFRADRSASLEALLARHGYDLDDREVAVFLADFVRLNPGVKGISLIRKGTVLRIPLNRLKKVGGPAGPQPPRIEPLTLVKPVTRSGLAAAAGQGPRGPVGETSLVRNAEALFRFLGRRPSVVQEGLRIFEVGDASSISLDTAFYPVLLFEDESKVVLDSGGYLPDDLKGLIEVSWPDYRIVSLRRGMDLRQQVAMLLSETGYVFQENETVSAGGLSRIIYHPDFLIVKEKTDVWRSDILMVSVIGPKESRTPPGLLSWFQERDLGLLELPYREGNQQNRGADVLRLDAAGGNARLAEEVVSLFGYPLTRDKALVISDGRGFTYTFKADMQIRAGDRTKIFQLRDIPPAEARSMTVRGFDVASLNPSDKRRDVVRKIVRLLSPSSVFTPEKNALRITPPGARYRLQIPGTFAETGRSPLFLTDSELPPRLLREVVRDDIRIANF